MRGKSDGTTTSCEYAISGLLKAGLIEVVGRKETVGRPFLYGTTDEFLKKFGLSSLEDLPDASEVLEKLKEIYAPDSDTLFRTRTAYDEEGNPVQEKTVRTAGKPCRIVMEASRNVLSADGKDLCYITVSTEDGQGNPCPLDERLVTFNVTGAGTFRAVANGDPTCLEPFHVPEMHLFNGKLTLIVSSSEVPGDIGNQARPAGLEPACTAVRTVPPYPMSEKADRLTFIY